MELSHVRRQLNRLQHWVVSPADHFPHSLTAHCLMSKTFLDEDVFLRCSQPAQQVLRNLELQVPQWIQLRIIQQHGLGNWAVRFLLS